MGLIEAFANKSVIGTDDLSLTAKAGESLLVKGIICTPPSDTALTIKTAKTTVGFFHLRVSTGSHLHCPVSKVESNYMTHDRNILALLLALGIFTGYPIAEGETMVFSGGSEALGVQSVVYEIWAAGDKKNTDPNGSKAQEYFFLNYGRYSGTLADGDNLYATRQCPVEFPDFPWNVTAPQGKVVTLHGVCFAPIAMATTGVTNLQNTLYVKFLQEREVLFDEDRNGILAYHAPAGANETNRRDGRGPFGLFTDIDPRLPFMFPEPLVFHGGEELGVYVSTAITAGAANIGAADAEITLIETVRAD